MKKPLKVGGVGIPNIDAYPPRRELLMRGLSALRELPGRSDAVGKVELALASLEKLHDYIEKRGGLRRGTKDDIAPESFDDLKRFIVHFSDAARLLNALPASHALPEPIRIKHLGGSVTNKLNAYKAGMGDSIEAFLIGIVGNDINGIAIKSRLAERHITLLDNTVTYAATQFNYILTEDRNGNALGDRHILKGRSNALSVLHQNEAFILNEVSKLDRLIIEGGEISAKKFGPDLFEKILDTAIQHNLALAYAPCTSHTARNESPRNAEILSKACFYSRNDMPTVLNTSELLDNYLPGEMKNATPHAPQDFRNDAIVALALANLKLELAHRETTMPANGNQPVAIVSDGANGLLILTSEEEQTLHLPAPKNLHVVDTTGAGDNLAAGAFIKASQLTGKKLTNAQLIEIASFAQKVASLAIEQYGACIDQQKLRAIL